MDTNKPVYLQGRGRGRGRGSVVTGGGRGVGQENAWQQKVGRSSSSWAGAAGRGPENGNSVHSAPARASPSLARSSSLKEEKSASKGGQMKKQLSADAKFQEAAEKHQESVRQAIVAQDDVESLESSDEEDLDEEKILNGMMQSFKQTSGGMNNHQELGSTQEYLSNTMKSKVNVCLICIETIRRNDAVWNCGQCYTMFHISCLQKWVKDGVYQQSALSEENFPKRDLPWHCPKCRQEYRQNQCPSRYNCFCGQTEDPSFDPWLVPHSCGQVCSRPLKPECGHNCLLLCHPGPCPPCPQTVQVRCYCGQQSPQTRRCGARQWSCSQPCSKTLGCGQHTCQHACHPDDCPACPETSSQDCQCGRHNTRRPCASPDWQCDEVCGEEYLCGFHKCELVCHPGECGQCPLSGDRTCPCGKTHLELPCTEEVPTCLETCNKTLACGKHKCQQRCHTGPCGTCREMVEKKCRCGKRTKEVQCHKEHLCETRCNELRDCGKHRCKRKCCDGQCAVCEQRCGKPLGCTNHKCNSICHRGPCYPCSVTVKVSCNCKSTFYIVPCGREKVAKKPKCKLLCKKPPNCHHQTRVPHACHQAECPVCQQICDKQLPGCSHRCPAKCHSAVKVWVQDKVERVGPWEAKPQARQEIQDKACPPCKVPVPVTCLGKHETVNFPCAHAKVGSCHRLCGRQLDCGNHICQLECHTVEGASDSVTAGKNCQKCEEQCSHPRPEGCSHPCLLTCHPLPCPDCHQMVRMRCHCSLVVRHVLCDNWSHADDTERARLRSCHGICPKQLACGHKCSAVCHAGSCIGPDRCLEKVRVRCPCRRQKRDFLCNEVNSGYGKVDCDEQCQSTKEKQKKQRAADEVAKKEQEEKRQQEEMDDYERRMGRRKKRQRKQRTEEEVPSFIQRYGKFIIAPTLVLILAVFLYYILLA